MSKIRLRDIIKDDSKVTFVFASYPKNTTVTDEMKQEHIYELDTADIANKCIKNASSIYMGTNNDSVFATAKQLYSLVRDIRKVSAAPIYISTEYTERKILNLRNYEKFYTMIREKFDEVYFIFGEVDDGKQSHFYRRKKAVYGKRKVIKWLINNPEHHTWVTAARKVRANGGYCVSAGPEAKGKPEWICPCKEFVKHSKPGEVCKCGRYMHANNN